MCGGGSSLRTNTGGGYGDGGKYGNSHGNNDDGYQNLKMAQQKRDKSRLKGLNKWKQLLRRWGHYLVKLLLWCWSKERC